MATSITEMTLFVSRASGLITFQGDVLTDPDSRVLYGPGNGRLYELAVIERSLFATDFTSFSFTLIDPHYGDTAHRLIRRGDQVLYDGERFAKHDVALDLTFIEIVPIPAVRVVQHLLRTPAGMFVCVSDDKYRTGSELLTMHIVTACGKSQAARHVGVALRPDRTFITAVEGVLDLKPGHEQWIASDGHSFTLERLDPEGYTVTEPGDGTMTITPKL